MADYHFPPVEAAMADPNGLLAMGGDLSPQRLLCAYRQGIFPWYGPGEPVLWWSPDPRMVLRPELVHITRSLSKVLRNRPYEVRFDTAFVEVIRACATPRSEEGGTWISEAMIAAYSQLFDLGYAHSVETWVDGNLAGGLYGVALGRMFFGESMFSRERDASKIALVHLCRHLQRQHFPLLDCQMHTDHLARMGAKPMARMAFCAQVRQLTALPVMPGPWQNSFANEVW